MDRITSHAELLHLSDGDPWVRWAVVPGAQQAWHDGRVALILRGDWQPGFWVTPLRGGAVDAGNVREALEWLASSGEITRTGSTAVSVVQPHVTVLEDVFRVDGGGDWTWMWTERAPEPDPREALLVQLDDSADAEEISVFSRANNPRIWTEVGTGGVHTWLGLRDAGGELIAVGGIETEDTGVPGLAGIVTAASRRGEGLGAVITTALTRRALATHEVCTLGVFSDNTTAIDLYARLGFRTGRAWSSRRLAT